MPDTAKSVPDITDRMPDTANKVPDTMKKCRIVLGGVPDTTFERSIQKNNNQHK